MGSDLWTFNFSSTPVDCGRGGNDSFSEIRVDKTVRHDPKVKVIEYLPRSSLAGRYLGLPIQLYCHPIEPL
jgi:hypothetical protein